MICARFQYLLAVALLSLLPGCMTSRIPAKIEMLGHDFLPGPEREARGFGYYFYLIAVDEKLSPLLIEAISAVLTRPDIEYVNRRFGDPKDLEKGKTKLSVAMIFIPVRSKPRRRVGAAAVAESYDYEHAQEIRSRLVSMGGKIEKVALIGATEPVFDVTDIAQIRSISLCNEDSIREKIDRIEHSLLVDAAEFARGPSVRERLESFFAAVGRAFLEDECE